MARSLDLAGGYRLLGVRPAATDSEVRAAYRRLVQIHHPDHNPGSPEAAGRFEAVRAAYLVVMESRRAAAAASAAAALAPATGDPQVEARLAALEREIAAARRRSPPAAKPAERQGARPSDEELGYVRTDDSFTKILDDLLGD